MKLTLAQIIEFVNKNSPQN